MSRRGLRLLARDFAIILGVWAATTPVILYGVRVVGEVLAR